MMRGYFMLLYDRLSETVLRCALMSTAANSSAGMRAMHSAW